MQHLQWFPGHMTAAMRMMEDSLKAVDGVLLVLDVRAPFASINKKLDNLFADKKVLYVLNKCDLVSQEDVKRILLEFAKINKSAIAVSSLDKQSIDKLYNGIFTLLKEKLERNRLKGISLPIRIMVAGVPNSGKSTIINALSGGKKASTGNKAGVTRGKQWVRLKDLELLDTPGTMPPQFENQTLAKHLAYIGSMNDANIDMQDLCFEFIKETLDKYKNEYIAKYQIANDEEDTLSIMNQICLRRGFLLRGGDYDYERCAFAVIDDFRKGRLGKIILE